jgi:hypothetical protein
MNTLRATVCIALIFVSTAACDGSHTNGPRAATTSTTASTSTPTTPKLAQETFADALRKHDTPAAQAAFAANARFYTPVLADPFVGHKRVSRLVAVLLDTFDGVHITAELRSPNQFALAFDAHIGTQPIHIFDLITFDGTGHIVTFVSHGRPLAGVEALGAAVGPHIADILRA